MEMPKFKDFTKAEMEEINYLFTPYLFYKTLPGGERYFECSSCNKSFEARYKKLMTNDDYELLRVGHNETATCPICGRVCTVKNKGKAKGCKNLYEEQRVVAIHKINKNYVQAIGRIAYKSYNYDYRPRIRFLNYNQSNYIFRPGEVIQYKKGDYYGTHQVKVASEPFTPKTGMSYWQICDNSYTVLGIKNLCSTFLRYNRLLEYVDHYTEIRNKNGYRVIEPPMMRYLCRFCEYPQIEILQKMGYWSFIEPLVEAGIKSFPMVNWRAKTVTDFFKMNKQEFKLFRENNGDLNFLRLKREIKKLTGECDIKKTIKWRNLMPDVSTLYYLESVCEILPKEDIYKKLKYLHKQAQKSNDTLDTARYNFEDYQRMAKTLKYDLKEETVRFPKDLRQAHDTVTEVFNAYLLEKKAKEEKELLEKSKSVIKEYKKLYCFSDGKFFIMVPTTTEEIINEGKEQHHCVGGYAARHLGGNLAICFLRNCEEPDKALYTIEMHKKTVKQVQGYGNKTPLTPEAKEFFDKWKAWVKGGSKRDRKGNPKLITA